MTDKSWTDQFLAKSGMKLAGIMLTIILLLLSTLSSLAMIGYNDLKDNNERVMEKIEEMKEQISQLQSKVDTRDQLDTFYQNRLDDHEERIRNLERR